MIYLFREKLRMMYNEKKTYINISVPKKDACILVIAIIVYMKNVRIYLEKKWLLKCVILHLLFFIN